MKLLEGESDYLWFSVRISSYKVQLVHPSSTFLSTALSFQTKQAYVIVFASNFCNYYLPSIFLLHWQLDWRGMWCGSKPHIFSSRRIVFTISIKDTRTISPHFFYFFIFIFQQISSPSQATHNMLFFWSRLVHHCFHSNLLVEVYALLHVS